MITTTLVASLTGHVEDRVWHVSWSHDGLYLASCGEDKIVRIWSNIVNPGDWDDSANISCISTLEDAQSRTLRCCEWSIDSKLIACVSFDGTVVVWESQFISKLSWEQVASLEGHENEVKSCAWDCEGKLLATCGRDKKIWIWEMLQGSEFECVAMLSEHTQDVKFVKFHHRLPILLSCSYDDTIKVWSSDGDDWRCNATLIGHSATVWGLTLALNAPRIISCSGDNSLIMWECDSPDLVGTWTVLERATNFQKFSIYSVDWSHDNGRILSSAGDNSIAISVKEGVNSIFCEEIIANAHDCDVNCVRWNPNTHFCNYFASAGDDGTVKIWRFCR